MTARPRTILFFLHSLGAGGAERVVALLASGLAERGWAVTLAVQVEAAENLPFLSPAVRVRRLGADHGRAVLGLARLLRRERPDVSVSALGFNNLKHALAAILAGRRDRAILSYHGHIDAEGQRSSRIANRLTPLTTRLTARSVCVSAWMRRHVVEDLGGDARRAVTVHNPVSVEHAAPARDERELLARPPTVLALGRLVPDKDFALLIRALAGLSQSDATLTIVGEGPERPALEALARELGVADRVSLPGYAAEPWVYFRQARLCAVSSRSESFSNVIVEAFAHGLPVVSTDCGGPREIITRPEEGRLVPVGDVAAMGAALDAALAAPGDPAPRRARAQVFSLGAALDAYERVFDAVTAEARPDPAAVGSRLRQP